MWPDDERGETPLTPRRAATLVSRPLLVLLAVACLGVTVSVVPGVRPVPGFSPLWDGGFQVAGYLLTAVVAGLRVLGDPRRRVLWSLVTAALALRAFAFVWSIYVLGRPPPYPSLSDACWLLSGGLLVVALGLLVRDQLPRTSRTILLDSLLGGLTAAAAAVSLLYPTLVALTQGGTPRAVVATNLAYPLIDVAQLVLVAGLVSVSGWRLSPSVTSIGVGVVALAVVDCVFLYLAAVGLFRPGTVLTPLSLVGTSLVALAGWLSDRVPRRRSREGGAGLVLPAALALVNVAVLLHGAPRSTSTLGPLLAAGGVAVALLRIYVTLVVDRQVADETIAVQQVELERFRALVETSSDFIAMAEPGGRLVYVNPAGRAMVGLSDDVEITTVAVTDLLPPEGQDGWEQIRFPALARLGQWQGESALLDLRTGDPVPVASSSFVIRDPVTGAGQLLGTVQRDISERKRAEEELLRFSALVAASSDFIAIAGVDGMVQYLNAAGREMVGLDPEVDVTTTTIADYLTEEGLRASLEVEQPAVVSEGHWEGESTLRDLRGGPPTPVAINSFLIRHPDSGEPWLLATVQRDISERKRAEMSLVRFGSLIEASGDLIAIAGLDGRLQYMNPAGRALVGLSPDVDITTTEVADFLAEDRIPFARDVERPAIIHQGQWQGESTLRDLRGGPDIPVAVNSFLIRDPDTGEPWLMATVNRDISQRIATEAAIQDLADQRQVLLGHLVEAQEAERARIAADVHDDSVQALAAVELRLALLQRELADGQPDLLTTVEALRGSVRGATERLRHLLFDLESPAQRTDLRTALSDAASYLFGDAGVVWRVEGDRGADVLEGTRVTAYRIAKEAMTNVSKHAAARHVRVAVAERDGGVEVSVVDDGTGFDPSLVVDRPGHLGLPGMVDRATVAGGAVEVVSAPGEGTTVTIRLPGSVGDPADGDHRTQSP